MSSASQSQILAVVGTGVMGRGIAQLAAQAGLTTLLFDAQEDAAAGARTTIAETLRRLAGTGRLDRAAADAAVERIKAADRLEELASADVVIDAIVENLEAKRKLFADLEAIVSADCVLATNTSSLSVTAIGAGLQRPQRFAGFHFFNPAPLMKIVEVVAGARTDDGTVARLLGVAVRMGHRAVRVKDTPGFLINHAGRGYVTEALRILAEGVASPIDVDRLMRDVCGFRMGPFELLDLTGLDVSHPVMESIYHQFYEEPRFRPSLETRRRLDAGLLGRKTGQGFYSYTGTSSTDEAPAPSDRPELVWVSAADSQARATVVEKLAALPQPPRIDEGPSPSPDALCIVTPWGIDATTTAVEQRLDATRTVAIDLLFGMAKRLTLMFTPLTSAAIRRGAYGLLASGGSAVTVIADSPGFVVQRMLATIANIGCEIAQQRIADAADIDAAVRLGLGYPHGPLALGDRMGSSRVLRILEGLQRTTGDPRYRPSLWLRRRGLLNVSLATPDQAE